MNDKNRQQPKPKHIVIIAGEASGDLHAANLVKEILAKAPDTVFSGIGGTLMQEVGVKIISDLARYGVTGIVEVIKHLKVIKQAFRATQKHLQTVKPDLLILVDYPGFNLRLAKYAKQVLGLRIIYYISPQLWAWKPGRIKVIQQNIDHMAVIFPFEKTIYEDANVDVSFVGHPLTMPEAETKRSLTCEAIHIPSTGKRLAILPGSRINEIERHLPVLFETAKKLRSIYPDLHCVIPIAKTLTPEQIKRYWHEDEVPTSFIENQKATEVANLCDAIIVASGTASLECALLAKPMCIIYKVHLITAIAAAIFLRVQYIGLCNLLSKRMIVPELLQYDCNATELTRVVSSLIDASSPLNQKVTKQLISLKKALSGDTADTSFCSLVLNTLAQEKKIANAP